MNEYMNNQGSEKDMDVQPSIEQLLPRYYELHPSVQYESLEMYDIDNHEVAWMQYASTDIAGRKIEGVEFKCACDFTEGVGWATHEQYGVVGLGGFEKNCQPRQKATDLRQQELRVDYVERFGDGTEPEQMKYRIQGVILDLIERDKASEFIGERSSGAHFWGGHFYLQTVNEIIGETDGHDMAARWRMIWTVVDKMVSDKQIQLEGMVVQDYYAPPVPEWVPYDKISYGGYVGVMSLPVHGHMPAEWRFTICDAAGEVVLDDQPGPRLGHEPTFGPDAEDVHEVIRAVQAAIDQLVNPAVGEGA